MCGFFGVISFKRDVDESNDFLQYALEDLSRRGPDQSGVWRGDNAI
jgi:asparagine synthetase B (glutamine-hydrolysing)